MKRDNKMNIDNKGWITRIKEVQMKPNLYYCFFLVPTWSSCGACPFHCSKHPRFAYSACALYSFSTTVGNTKRMILK